MISERDAIAELSSLRNQRALGPARLDAALSIVCRALDVPLAKVLELSEAHDALRVRAGIGWRRGVVSGTTIPASSSSIAGYALRHRRAILVDDVQQTARFANSTLLRSHAVRSTMAVRLCVGERVIGVLTVHTVLPRRFNADDARFLEATSPIIADMML